jgi:hypothetical protein
MDVSDHEPPPLVNWNNFRTAGTLALSPVTGVAHITPQRDISAPKLSDSRPHWQ